MMDESFNPYNGAGGWGAPNADASFGGPGATQGTSKKPNEHEKVTIPVTVATLNAIEPGSEKVTYGEYSFTTARVIGVINSVTENQTDIAYYVTDRRDETGASFKIIQYFGVEETTPHTSFIEGTVIEAIGKIRSFDDTTTLVAYSVKEVTDSSVETEFEKLARVAELYYTKNVPELISTNNLSAFNGTILSADAPPSNNRNSAPGATGSTFTAASTANGGHVYNTTFSQGGGAVKGNNAQQNKIIEYMMNNGGTTETGCSVQELRAAVGNNPNFDNDMNELGSNGVVYSTCDDEHFALIV
uniref:RPA_C domain-containing protein n=1 Tax=Panagrellus redivivus TaxID=6233 RepID=A0A7E4VAD1_PANRE